MQRFLLVLFTVLAAAFAPAQELPGPETAPPSKAQAPADLEAQDRKALLMDAGAKYASEGKYPEAKLVYQRALESDPDNQEIRFRIGTLCIQMGEYAEAVSVLEELLQETPENAVLLNNLAWVYAMGGDMRDGKRALYYAREAILSAPFSASTWNTLAEAHYVLGEYEQARRASEFAQDLLQIENPTDEQRSAFQTQYQKIQRAIESSRMLLKLDQNTP